MNQVQKRTQIERSELSDKKMFEATIELIVQCGPAGTSLKQVGELAGYSRGLASQRFGSKSNLFSFTLKRLGEMWRHQLTGVTKGRSGIEAIEKALDQHYQFCLESPNHVYTFYSLWFDAVNANSELANTVQQIHNRRQQDVVEWITASPDIDECIKKQADMFAEQFCASVVGIIYYWFCYAEDMQRIKKMHDDLKMNVRKQLFDV